MVATGRSAPGVTLLGNEETPSAVAWMPTVGMPTSGARNRMTEPPLLRARLVTCTRTAGASDASTGVLVFDWRPAGVPVKLQ